MSKLKNTAQGAATPNGSGGQSFAQRYRGVISSIGVYVVLNLVLMSAVTYYQNKGLENERRINGLITRQQTFSQRAPLLLHEMEAEIAAGKSGEPGVHQLEFTKQLFDESIKAMAAGGMVTDIDGVSKVEIGRVIYEMEKPLKETAAAWLAMDEAIAPLIEAGSEVTLAQVQEAKEAVAGGIPLLAATNKLYVVSNENSGAAAGNVKTVQIMATIALLGLFSAIIIRMITRLRERDREVDLTSRSLAESNSSLATSNSQLEETTTALAQANAEGESILNSVDQGLFLIDRDYKIGGQYSAIAEKILHAKQLSGISLLHLFKPLVTDKEYNTITDYFELQFDRRKRERQLTKFNPLEQLECQFPGENGQHVSKVLRCGFRRVMDTDGEISRVLVTVSDVTAQHELETKLASAEKKRERQFELVVDMLNADPNELHAFLRKSREQIDKINVILQDDDYLNEGVDAVVAGHQEKVEDVFRAVHTIKGAAGLCGLSPFIERCGAIEDELEHLRGLKQVTGDKFISALIGVGDLRMDTEEIESLLEKLAGYRPTTERPAGLVQSASGETIEVEEESAAKLFQGSLEKLAASVSKRQGKTTIVDLERAALDELPDKVLEGLEDVFVQLVRNSVSHGIETPAERLQKGKYSDGRITVRTHFREEKDGSRSAVIRFRDDGRGLQMDKIREKALAKGLATEQELDEMDDAHAALLILEPGFSTSDNADEDSGRGVGLHILKSELIDKLDGGLDIRFREDLYCQFTLEVPVSQPKKKEAIAAKKQPARGKTGGGKNSRRKKGNPQPTDAPVTRTTMLRIRGDGTDLTPPINQPFEDDGAAPEEEVPRKAPRVRVKAPGGSKAETSGSDIGSEKLKVAVQHDDGQEQISLPS